MQLTPRSKTKYTGFSKRLAMWTTLFISSVVVIFTFSETAYAGLFSFVASFISGEQASAKITLPPVINSQNIALLQAAVNQDPNPDKPGETVPVVGGETLVADIASNNVSESDTSNTQISTYVVREGDTISGVAKMFKVSVNTVLWANNLTSRSVLQAGQTLVILPISGITYTIKKGDTIQGIAKTYKADANDILNYNDMTLAATLVVGQTLIIPDGELAAPTPKPGIHNGKVYEPLLDNVRNLPSYPGYYMCPVGVVTQGLHGHNAIDVGAPSGTPIGAAAGGTVIIDKMNGGWNGGYGNYVVVSHNNGTQTLYAHMQGSAVSAGDTVVKGQTIGSVGSTGMSTGPHVHFEIRGAKNPCGN
jgi:LysM repeat protein